MGVAFRAPERPPVHGSTPKGNPKNEKTFPERGGREVPGREKSWDCTKPSGINPNFDEGDPWKFGLGKNPRGVFVPLPPIPPDFLLSLTMNFLSHLVVTQFHAGFFVFSPFSALLLSPNPPGPRICWICPRNFGEFCRCSPRVSVRLSVLSGAFSPSQTPQRRLFIIGFFFNLNPSTPPRKEPKAGFGPAGFFSLLLPVCLQSR